jgi:hypothetical protein
MLPPPIYSIVGVGRAGRGWVGWRIGPASPYASVRMHALPSDTRFTSWSVILNLLTWPVWPDWENSRLLGNCFLGDVVLKITKVGHSFGQLFSAVQWFRHKMGWPTFWGILSQSRLVTLDVTERARAKRLKMFFLCRHRMTRFADFSPFGRL